MIGQGSGPGAAPGDRTGLPGFSFEYIAKRDARTGRIIDELIAVRSMKLDHFVESVKAIREWIGDLPIYPAEAPAEAEAIGPDQGPPAQCPECGGTDFYDNRGDKDPNWRCKRRSCGHRIPVGAPAEAPAIAGVNLE